VASYRMVLELTWLVRHLKYQELKITVNFVLPQIMKEGDCNVSEVRCHSNSLEAVNNLLVTPQEENQGLRNNLDVTYAMA